MDGWMDKSMGKWMDGGVNRCWKDGWVDRWMVNGWMAGWMNDGWMDGAWVGGGEAVRRWTERQAGASVMSRRSTSCSFLCAPQKLAQQGPCTENCHPDPFNKTDRDKRKETDTQKTDRKREREKRDGEEATKGSRARHAMEDKQTTEREVLVVWGRRGLGGEGGSGLQSRD